MFLGCPTYRRFEECVKMIRSVQEGTLKPKHIIIWDNSSGGFLVYLHENEVQLKDVTVYSSPVNMACARSWNAMLKIFDNEDPDEPVMIINDDIEVLPDTLEHFERAFKDNPDEVLFCSGGLEAPNAFSMFVTSLKRLEPIGLFDEFFKYAYGEDSDMALRIWKSGRQLYRVESAGIKSHIGSGTIKSYDPQELELHHWKHRRNTHYFMFKWRIMDNQIHTDLDNAYNTPFNGDEMEEELAKNYIVATYGE